MTVRARCFTLHSHLKAENARSSKRAHRQIVPLRSNAERPATRSEPAARDLERRSPLPAPPSGTLTAGNHQHAA